MKLFKALRSFKRPQFDQRAASDHVIQTLTAAVSHLSERLERIEGLASRIEHLEHGGRATYVGNGRVLTKVAFPAFNLSLLVEGNDRLIAPNLITSGIHEPEITDHFLRNVKHTDHCIDIGANIGYFSCLMGRLAFSGRTVAVEADPQTFNLLRDNVYINFLEATTMPICGAVSDSEGPLTLHRRITRSGNTSIIMEGPEKLARLGEPPSEKVTVDSFRIDRLLDRMDGRVDHMKIDIEGAEPLAFAGMERTLAANPAIRIVMEWAPAQISAAGFDIGEFLAKLSGLGLHPAKLTQDGPESISYEDLFAMSYASGILLTLMH